MTYELAKQLKDAGFPQEGDGYVLHTPNCKGWDAPSDCTHKTRAYVPTLEELIEACGDDFRDLVYHSKRTPDSTYRRWTAKGGMRTIGYWKLISGHSPEEAVARLWIALNKV